MLGELIYEGKGKMIGMRVLDNNGTMETTSQAEGTILGLECTTTLTIVITHRPDGTGHSEGYGMMFTKEGDAATLTTSAISIPKGPMPAGSVRGTTFFRTQSPKLARLNNIVSIYETEVNEDLSYEVKYWEWK